MTSDNPLLITCVGVDHDIDMFPHFLRHYLTLGVRPESIHPLLNARHADAPGMAKAHAMLAEAGIPGGNAEIWIAPYTSDSMWKKRRELQKRLCGEQDWVISADVDEFHFYPEPLTDFLARCDALKVNCVQGVFVDRLAEGGSLAEVREEPDLLEQFPIEAEVALSIAGRGEHHGLGGTVKIMAMRGYVMPNRGGHAPLKDQRVSLLYKRPLGRVSEVGSPDFRFSLPTRVAHIHWTSSLPARLRERLATPGLTPAGLEYGQKQLDHLERHDGIALDQVALAPSDWPGNWEKRLSRLRFEARKVALKSAIRSRISAVKRRVMGAS